jgi:acetylglutamate kinase
VTAPFVVKVGGAALEQPEAHPALWQSFVDLHLAHPGGVVLVHGGGSAIDRHLERLQMPTERREGIRITPPEQIEEITAVLAGRVNKALVGLLLTRGAAAVGLCLGDGGLARTERIRGYAFDPGRVGEVVGGEARLLHVLLAERFLPVLCSIGLDAHGERWNVNADDAAAALAAILRAQSLLLLTDVPAVLDAEKRPIAELDQERAEALIASGVIAGGMIPKVRGALKTAAACGSPVTIASWKNPAELPRLAAGADVGTRCLPPRVPASSRA